MDTSGVLTRLGRTIQTLLEVRQETEVHFLVGTVILGFLSNFKKSQALSPYDALNSVCLSRGQTDVRSPIQMRRASMVFSRLSKGDSNFPSYFEMKNEPSFKPLQGNLTFFLVRTSQYLSHLRQETHGPSDIPFVEGRLLLWPCFKVGLSLQYNPASQLSFQDDMGCMELSSSSCAEIGVPIVLRRVSQGISVVA